MYPWGTKHKAQSAIMCTIWVFLFYMWDHVVGNEVDPFYVSSVAASLAPGLREACLSGALLWPGHKVHFSLMRPLTS